MPYCEGNAKIRPELSDSGAWLHAKNFEAAGVEIGFYNDINILIFPLQPVFDLFPVDEDIKQFFKMRFFIGGAAPGNQSFDYSFLRKVTV